MVDVDVCREDEDGDVGQLRADRARSLEALGRVRRRHTDVDDRKIGLVQAHEGKEVIPVTGLTDDLEAVPVKQTRDAFPQQEIVVRDDDPHAARALVPLIRRGHHNREVSRTSSVGKRRIGYVSTEGWICVFP